MLIINQWEDVIPQQPVHEPLTKDDYETYPESEPPYILAYKTQDDYRVMNEVLKDPFKNKLINHFSVNLDDFRESHAETVEILTYNQNTISTLDEYAGKYCLCIYGDKRNLEVYFCFNEQGIVIENDYPYGELKTAYEILVQLPDHFRKYL